MTRTAIFAMLFIASFHCFAQGYVKFEDKGKFGFKNKAGKVMIPATFTMAWDKFAKGLVGVKKGEKWGYIDTLGKLIVPYKYSEVSEFLPAGLAMVYIGDHIGCIDTTGKVVVPVIYENGNLSFSPRSVFMATMKGKTGILDAHGKIKIPLIYEDMNHLTASDGFGFYIVKLSGMYGTIDDDNQPVIPIKYELVERDWLHPEIYRLKVTLSGKEGYVDLRGNEL